MAMWDDPTTWMEPGKLEALLASLQASDEDRKRARAMALAQAGFSMMGAPRGQEFAAIGNAGMMGLQGYQQELSGAQQNNLQKLLLGQQLRRAGRDEQEYRKRQEREAAIEEARKAGIVPGRPGGMGDVDEGLDAGLQPGAPPTFDYLKYAAALAPHDPLAALNVKKALQQDSPFDKPKIEDFTPESRALFLKTRNPADLVKIPDKQWVEIAREGDGILMEQTGTGDRKWVGNPAPRISQKTDVVVPGQKQQTEFDKAVGKDQGEYYSTLQRSARAAGTKLQNLNAIQALLLDVNTDALTPLGMEIAGKLRAFGIELDPKLGRKEAAAAIANKMALDARSTADGGGMPGAMSDKDREFLRQLNPNLSQTPEGRRLIIEVQRRLALRDQEIARIARRYVEKNNRLDEGFYDEIERSFADRDLFADIAGRLETGSSRSSGGRVGNAPASGNGGTPAVIDFHSVPRSR